MNISDQINNKRCYGDDDDDDGDYGDDDDDDVNVRISYIMNIYLAQQISFPISRYPCLY